MTASVTKPPLRPKPPVICEVVPLHKRLVDLEDGECKFPYGDNNFTFCAHKALKISLEGIEKPTFLPYCPWHTKLTTG